MSARKKTVSQCHCRVGFQMVRHGGCLGLGLAAMGTYRQDVYDQLRANLYLDDAVAGEAAGIAMGMVMLGSKEAQAIQDMVAVSTSPLRLGQWHHVFVL